MRKLSDAHAELETLKRRISILELQVSTGSPSRASGRQPPTSASEQIAVDSREPLQPPPQALSPIDHSNALDQATALILRSDIPSGQLLLERAIHTGSGRAAFLLAQTYDPRVLKSWKAYGVRADPKKARELYERAYESGIAQAKQRAEALAR